MQNNAFSMKELVPLMQEVIGEGGEFRLFPRGTSMLPLLREGRDSVILVAPAVLKKRDICLYRRQDGTYVLHRLIKWDKAGGPVFCGDNQTALEYGVPSESVVAVVSAYYRGDKRIEVSAFSYRLYSFWHCVFPLRRLRFLPRRTWGLLRRLVKRKKS